MRAMEQRLTTTILGEQPILIAAATDSESMITSSFVPGNTDATTERPCPVHKKNRKRKRKKKKKSEVSTHKIEAEPTAPSTYEAIVDHPDSLVSKGPVGLRLEDLHLVKGSPMDDSLDPPSSNFPAVSTSLIADNFKDEDVTTYDTSPGSRKNLLWTLSRMRTSLPTMTSPAKSPSPHLRTKLLCLRH